VKFLFESLTDTYLDRNVRDLIPMYLRHILGPGTETKIPCPKTYELSILILVYQ